MINYILLAIFTYTTLFAACNISTDIKENSDGTFTYTEECHIFVGKQFQELEKRKQQVDKLNEALELKDLAIEQHKKRIQLWKDTTFELEDRMIKMEKLTTLDRILHFGLGVLATSVAVYASSKINR